MDEQVFYTPEEIAQRFKVQKRTVYGWIRDGKLKAIRIGNLLRVPEEALQQFILESGERRPVKS